MPGYRVSVRVGVPVRRIGFVPGPLRSGSGAFHTHPWVTRTDRALFALEARQCVAQQGEPLQRIDDLQQVLALAGRQR